MSGACGENHGAHVAAVGNQPGRAGKSVLAVQQSGANRRHGGHPGGLGPGRFGADCARHVLPAQQDPLIARLVHCEFDVQPAGHLGVTFGVVRADALPGPRQGYQPIQRPAVQQVQAQRGGDPAGDGAFAGAARAVDGDDGDSLS